MWVKLPRGPRALAYLGLWAAVALPFPAAAGPRPFAFVHGAEGLPETGLELESWFGADKSAGANATWEWWLGPVLGVTDRVEVAFFGIFSQRPAVDGQAGPLQLDSLRLQASALLADRGEWPLDVRIRAEVGLPAAADATEGWLGVVAALTEGRFNATLNLGTAVEVAKLDQAVSTYLDGALGLSVRLPAGFTVGAELHGQKSLSGEDETMAFLGPCASFGLGRLWASASIGFGLTSDSPSRRGRVVVGLAF